MIFPDFSVGVNLHITDHCTELKSLIESMRQKLRTGSLRRIEPSDRILQRKGQGKEETLAVFTDPLTQYQTVHSYLKLHKVRF